MSVPPAAGNLMVMTTLTPGTLCVLQAIERRELALNQLRDILYLVEVDHSAQQPVETPATLQAHLLRLSQLFEGVTLATVDVLVAIKRWQAEVTKVGGENRPPQPAPAPPPPPPPAFVWNGGDYLAKLQHDVAFLYTPGSYLLKFLPYLSLNLPLPLTTTAAATTTVSTTTAARVPLRRVPIQAWVGTTTTTSTTTNTATSSSSSSNGVVTVSYVSSVDPDAISPAQHALLSEIAAALQARKERCEAKALKATTTTSTRRPRHPHGHHQGKRDPALPHGHAHSSHHRTHSQCGSKPTAAAPSRVELPGSHYPSSHNRSSRRSSRMRRESVGVTTVSCGGLGCSRHRDAAAATTSTTTGTATAATLTVQQELALVNRVYYGAIHANALALQRATVKVEAAEVNATLPTPCHRQHHSRVHSSVK